jgi:hypothetical protein
MKKNFLKISGGIVLVTVLVLIYTAAVTQTSRLPKYAGKNSGAINDDTDTTDIGLPTGDDPWKELDNLVKAYYVKTGVLYQGTMKLFDGNGDKDKLLEEKKFEFTCFNNEYSYSLAPFEVINKKNFTVIVNHEDKVVAVASKITERTKSKDLFSLADFRKILEEQKANIKVTQLGNEKILTIDSIQDPDIQGYRIYYSPQTYKVSKMIVGMLRFSPLDDEPGEEDIKKTEDIPKEETGTEGEQKDQAGVEGYFYYVEINYSVISPLSLRPGAFNPENKFVKIDGKKIELTAEFKEYELFNSVEP